MPRTSNLHPNLAAFLDMIAFSEIGRDLLKHSDDGYNVIVGGGLFVDYSDHPRARVWVKRIKRYSTAAGRYQVLARYFDAYKLLLNLPDFSPESQDKIAIQLIRECRAMDEIEAGKIHEAIYLCRSRWASLPGAAYGQHENKMADLIEAYLEADGSMGQ